jgi:hypothetical protein
LRAGKAQQKNGTDGEKEGEGSVDVVEVKRRRATGKKDMQMQFVVCTIAA